MVKKNKIILIISISVLVVCLLGGTYAYYKSLLSKTSGINSTTRGLDYYINYTKGTDVTSGIIVPSTDYKSGNNVSITLNKKNDSYDIYGHIYLDITSVGTNISTSKALKYTVLEGTTIISEGVLGGVSSNKSYLIAGNIPLKIEKTNYEVYLWLDESVEADTSKFEGEGVAAKIRCEASLQEINESPYTSSISSEA